MRRPGAAICDVFTSFLFGLPGAMKPLRRLRELCAILARQQNAPWQIDAMAHTAWPEIWHGERGAAADAVARQTALAEQVRRLNALQSAAVYAAASGDFERGASLDRGTAAALESLQLPTLSRTWRRLTLQNLVCIHWMAQDLEALLPIFAPERDRFEWPVVDTGRALIRGRCALLRGDLKEAEVALEQACLLHQRWRMPTFMGDARISLAILRLEQGDRAAAWHVFWPVLQEQVTADCLGPLLMEPRKPLDRLLGLIPPPERNQAAVQVLIRRLEPWRVAGSGSPASSSAARGPLQVLSQREREVLARIVAGDSNKLIARSLDLSPHTVKRHVANILVKLEVSTRSAAAGVYRQYK